MRVKKRFCSILLCSLLLAGCVQEQPVTVYQMPEKAEQTYDLREVEVGTFKIVKEVTISPSYMKKQSVIVNYEDAILKEKSYLVLGDRVKAGDVLATLTFKTSDVELARLELAYERAVYSMDNGISSYYQSIASIQGDDRSSYLQRMQIEYQLASYKLSAERQCQQALERLEEYKARYQDLQILAPCDGIITYVNSIRPEEEVPVGTELFTLADPKSIYLELDTPMTDSEGPVTYPMISVGSEARVTRGDYSRTCKITNAPILGERYKNPEISGEKNGVAYITGNDLDTMAGTGSFSVQYTVLELENMMMLPWRAVHDYKFRYAPAPKVDGVTVEKDPYVNLLVDGQVIKRYVICGPSNGAQICILDGLTPGQQVVVD